LNGGFADWRNGIGMTLSGAMPTGHFGLELAEGGLSACEITGAKAGVHCLKP